MIKAGDKVVCIKDDEHVYSTRKSTYREGVTYEVLYTGESGAVCIKCDDGGFDIYFIHRQLRSIARIFSDYFILLAEWREKQIKSVIDD